MVVAGHGVMVPIESPSSASEDTTSESDENDQSEAPPMEGEEPPS
jgi:hypothetical protein